MKNIKALLVGFPILLTTLGSCEPFTEINNSVATVYDVEPVTMLYQVQNHAQGASSTWIDSYASKLRWMQYCSNVWGYALTNFTYFSGRIGSDAYSEYIKMGGYARHIEYYIASRNEADLPQYTNLIEVARIMLIYKAISVSDIYGSLVYTEGWGLKSGKPELTHPKYETQQALLDLWDKELKEAVVRMKAATNQKSLEGYDLAYNGEMSRWIKAANGLRLRIATRLLKRDRDKAKIIAAEVLASDVMSENKDGLILRFDKLYTSKGDWHSVIDMDRASAPFMEYLTKYEDPRKRIYFQINNLTPENIATYNSEQTDSKKHIPTDFTRWEGGTVSFDERADDKRYASKSLKDGTDMRAMNRPQTRLWKGMQDNGSGGSWFPLLTYADFCFMASEFVLEGVASSQSAQVWYEEGVKSSLTQWSEIGDYCKINDYEAITPEEVTAFISQKGIAWDSSIAKEQIYCQAWVEHFKNNNESWVQWRRTGYPNQESQIITFDKVMVSEAEQRVPRRMRYNDPVDGIPNYENEVNSIQEMAKDPEFGLPLDEFGRIWWDKE